MKLFLIGTLLFSGGSAAAMQNETVNENVTGIYQNVRERVQKRVKENTFQNLKENGFPYPSETRLENLTEEQQVAIITAIDQINARYDFTSMTDEELTTACIDIQAELNLLADELGLDIPDDWMRSRFQNRVNTRTKQIITRYLLEDLRTNGIEYPSEERLANLTVEQSEAILEKIDELNLTYDWASMTDDEIMEAMLLVKEELVALHDVLGITPPTERHQNQRRHKNNQNQNDDVVEGTDEV